MASSLPLACPSWDDREVAEMESVIRSGQFSMGPRVRQFESDLAAYHSVAASVMVNSGSSANLIMLAACRYAEVERPLGPGDEVITPAVSWGTTYYPINQAGAIIRLIDVDPDTLNLTVESVAEATNSKTRAVLAVNLLGNPAPLDELRTYCEEKGLILLEDNCESLGASLNGELTGTFGAMASESFFFSHHISTMEGGAVLVSDQRFHETLLMLRAHGWTRDLPRSGDTANPDTYDRWSDSFHFVLPGYNVRPIELEAAVGIAQLEKLPGFLTARRSNAAVWQQLMDDCPDVRIQKETGKSSWFGFSMVLEGRLQGKRHELIEALSSIGVDSRPIVAGNILRHPVADRLLLASREPLAIADRIHEEGLFIGNHHFDISEALARVRQTLNRLG